jgi:Kef-type K+ transport system membrane component KefB
MRQAIFGWGSVQMLLSALLLGLLVKLLLGLSLTVAIIIGFTLSLSSTAFALQMLAEQGQLKHRFGRSAFTILLFQDIAVVPLLAIIPLLGTADDGATQALNWQVFFTGLGIIVIIIVAGRFLLQHFLRRITRSGVQEIMTAATDRYGAYLRPGWPVHGACGIHGRGVVGGIGVSSPA